CLSLFDPSRLQNRYVCPGECLLNRRWLDQLRASDWFVGLGHNADDVVLRLQQSLQRRRADFARADENDAHARTTASVDEPQRNDVDAALPSLAPSIFHQL